MSVMNDVIVTTIAIVERESSVLESRIDLAEALLESDLSSKGRLG